MRWRTSKSARPFVHIAAFCSGVRHSFQKWKSVSAEPAGRPHDRQQPSLSGLPVQPSRSHSSPEDLSTGPQPPRRTLPSYDAYAFIVFSPSTSAAHGFADLPGVAEGVASARLGRDDPAYHVQDRDTGYQASNPQHGFTASFSPQGLVVHAGADEWRLTYVGYGDGEESVRDGEVAPEVRANRVEYRRGGLTEWYVNGPLGLQQGFTVHEPLPAPDDQDPRSVVPAPDRVHPHPGGVPPVHPEGLHLLRHGVLGLRGSAQPAFSQGHEPAQAPRALRETGPEAGLARPLSRGYGTAITAKQTCTA